MIGNGLRGVLLALGFLAAARANTVAAAPETARVPLQVIDVGGGELKLGIEISLGGGPPRLYEFDTGAAGFYAARNEAWWPSFTVVDDRTFDEKYGSHVEYVARKVSTEISIPNLDQVDLSARVDVAQILDGFGGPLGPRDESTWRDDVARGDPPLYGAFFGDFGADLRPGMSGIFAVLPQLPGNLSSGFIVSFGCYARPRPELTIGLTDESRARFTALVPMQPSKDPVDFPGSGFPTRDQRLVRGTFAVSRAGAATAFETGVILDTGAPTTHVHSHGAVRIPDDLLTGRAGDEKRSVLPEAAVAFTAPGVEPADGWDLRFTTGDVLGLDRVDVSEEEDEGYVNLGLNAFVRYDVLFDVEAGVVGFAPCATTPRLPGVRFGGIVEGLLPGLGPLAP